MLHALREDSPRQDGRGQATATEVQTFSSPSHSLNVEIQGGQVSLHGGLQVLQGIGVFLEARGKPDRLSQRALMCAVAIRCKRPALGVQEELAPEAREVRRRPEDELRLGRVRAKGHRIDHVKVPRSLKVACEADQKSQRFHDRVEFRVADAELSDRPRGQYGTRPAVARPDVEPILEEAFTKLVVSSSRLVGGSHEVRGERRRPEQVRPAP